MVDETISEPEPDDPHEHEFGDELSPDAACRYCGLPYAEWAD